MAGSFSGTEHEEKDNSHEFQNQDHRPTYERDHLHSCAQVIRYCAWKNKEKSRQIFQNIENDRSIGVEFVV